MKRTLSFTLVICFTVLLLSWGASAASGSYRVYKAPEGIVMDGFADDWAVGGLEPTLRVDSNISLIRAGSVARAETTSADLYLLYDEHYFYVFAKVTDDLVMGSASGSGIWQNSGLELWLSFSGVVTSPADYATYTARDYQINFTPMTGSQFAPQAFVYPATLHVDHNAAGNIEVAASLWSQGDRSGYIIEARLPRQAFPGIAELSPGDTFGLALSLVFLGPDGSWGQMWTPGVEYVAAAVE